MRTVTAAKALFVVRDEGLVLRRSASYPNDQHLVDLPGGIVETDETPLEGLLREIQEETGVLLDASDAKLVYVETEPSKTKPVVYLEHFYIVSLKTKPTIQLSWEHDLFEWRKIDAVYDLPPPYQRGLDFAFRHALLKLA